MSFSYVLHVPVEMKHVDNGWHILIINETYVKHLSWSFQTLLKESCVILFLLQASQCRFVCELLFFESIMAQYELYMQVWKQQFICSIAEIIVWVWMCFRWLSYLYIIHSVTFMIIQHSLNQKTNCYYLDFIRCCSTWPCFG